VSVGKQRTDSDKDLEDGHFTLKSTVPEISRGLRKTTEPVRIVAARPIFKLPAFEI
jgi:hypothetical protein